MISDEEFYATPAHLRGLDRVVDPNAPSFMASRSAMPLVVVIVGGGVVAAADCFSITLPHLTWTPLDAPQTFKKP